jgi:hypothetical protein
METKTPHRVSISFLSRARFQARGKFLPRALCHPQSIDIV